jgi:pimeloyl-ACP methyl ester carboxylesterase
MTLNKPNTYECVILLHGLARTANSMKKMARALECAGYITLNINYPSTQHPIKYLAASTITKALDQCPKNAVIHFVTHSMGGILLRQYLSEHSISNIGRVVMLGPPNKGSHLVDNLQHIPGFKFINCPAGMQLGTSKLSAPNVLRSAMFELGIIAGTLSLNPLLSLMIPKPNDGKVSVEHTKLEGMTDHIELSVTHSFMMNNNMVISQVLHFLKNGIFKN